MTRRVRGGALVIVLVLAAVLVVRHRARPRYRLAFGEVRTRTAVGLDVARFRESLVRRRAVVAELRRRYPRPAADAAGRARAAGFGLRLTTPLCILGPADLCAALDDSVVACGDGDAQACLAVGQYLEEAPPRPMVGIVFFSYACSAGEREACEHLKVLRELGAAACGPDGDPLGCAWHASRSHDPADQARACELGVADACAFFAVDAPDPGAARVYLERGCQLGSPMVCAELGRRLLPDCDQDCYPPDPVQAAAASTIACEAGDEHACARLP